MSQAPPAVPTARPASPPPVERVARRITLQGVPWAVYDELLKVVGNGLPRMTYDRGLLELEMPSELHEMMKWTAGHFIEAYAEEAGIRYRAAGSTTWRRQAFEGGLEADESYYLQNLARVRGRTADLTVDPPPDLAVEIDLTAPDVEKESIYARLGVPEIWRWRDNRLSVLVRQGNGSYGEQEQSVALPGFPLQALAEALDRCPEVEPEDAVANFRRTLRAQPPKA